MLITLHGRQRTIIKQLLCALSMSALSILNKERLAELVHAPIYARRWLNHGLFGYLRGHSKALKNGGAGWAWPAASEPSGALSARDA